jgi:hypothetical protein
MWEDGNEKARDNDDGVRDSDDEVRDSDDKARGNNNNEGGDAPGVFLFLVLTFYYITLVSPPVHHGRGS